MGADKLSRVERHHPADDRLAGKSFWPETGLHFLHRDVHIRVGVVRHGGEPADADSARILQGAGGGAMVPIAQAILLESFPVAKRGVAMATFSMAVIVAPIIGPTLGGWITDNYSWRWIFYINLPVGLLAMFLAEWLVEDPPYIKRNLKAAIDFVGFGLLVVWLATLQITLDKGQEADWFGSNGYGGLWAFRLFP